MNEIFPFHAAPFDTLTPAQQALVRDSAAVVDFDAGTVLLDVGDVPAGVHLLIDGHVQQVGDSEVAPVHGPGDLLGVRAVIAGRASDSLRALDAVRAWRIPSATVQALIAANGEFGAIVFGELSRRLGSAAQRRPNREFVALMTARVRDAFVRKPFFVDGADDLVSACRQMSIHGHSNALVHDGGRTGMFTTTDLRDALLRAEPPDRIRVREVARFELIEIDAGAELVEALLLMLRYRVHRLVVRERGEIVGLLNQLDLMSFVSNHSYLIATQVEQAGSVAELKAAAQQIDGLIELLHDGGVRVEVISRLVGELNRHVFDRLWRLLAPPELVRSSCLIVMGSEGRGEQILKTDQDNALLLRDGYRCDGLDAIAERFTAALIDFGYPRCPGDIMLTNPLWRQPLAGFRETLRDWMFGAQPEGPMNLAIFVDAAVVTGDAALLQQARRFVHDFLPDNAAFLARFASAAENLADEGGWWSRFAPWRADPVIDLKKIGTFPIVHGLRALALEQRIEAVGSVERMRELVARELLPADLARDLTDTLHFLMGCKLRNNLRQRQLGQPIDNKVRLSDFGTLDRDLLKDSLAIIKRFRLLLQQHFRLGTLQ